jgi:predicted enzyme related to lactoylglutathione lyase
MKTSGITAALPAQDLGRAKAFYAEKVGLQALESGFLTARDGQVGLTVGNGASQLFVYPARVRSSGEFTQAVIHVADVRAAVEEMRGRGVEFEEYDTPETRTERHCPDARWRRGGLVQGLRRQPGRRCSSLRRISSVSEPPCGRAFDVAVRVNLPPWVLRRCPRRTFAPPPARTMS